jgi:hypothetical protein
MEKILHLCSITGNFEHQKKNKNKTFHFKQGCINFAARF